MRELSKNATVVFEQLFKFICKLDVCMQPNVASVTNPEDVYVIHPHLFSPHQTGYVQTREVSRAFRTSIYLQVLRNGFPFCLYGGRDIVVLPIRIGTTFFLYFSSIKNTPSALASASKHTGLAVKVALNVV